MSKNDKQNIFLPQTNQAKTTNREPGRIVSSKLQISKGVIADKIGLAWMHFIDNKSVKSG